jgi:hypothetical protein
MSISQSLSRLNYYGTHRWAGLEDSTVLGAGEKLITSLSAIDDDNPSVCQAHLEDWTVDLAPHVVGVGGVRAALEETTDDGPSAWARKIGFRSSGLA